MNDSLIDHYRAAFWLVLRHKWLYLLPLLLVIVNQLYSFAFTIYFRSYQPELFGNPFPQKTRYLFYTFSERLASLSGDIDWNMAATHAISLLSPSALFENGILGIAIILLVFRKRIKETLKNHPSLKNKGRCFIYVGIVGLLIGLFAIFISNIWLAMLGSSVALVGFLLLLVELVTFIEGLFLLYLKSVLKNEVFILEVAMDEIGQNWKPLYFLNIFLVFLSPKFYVELSLIPGLIVQFLPSHANEFFSLFPGSYIFPNAFFAIIGYIQVIAMLVFLFTPFLLIQDSRKFITGIQNNLALIKSNLLFYIGFVISGAVILMTLSYLEQLILTAPVFSNVFDGGVGLMYSLLLMFFLVVFSVTVFGWLIEKTSASNR